jgi:hypothetical protein
MGNPPGSGFTDLINFCLSSFVIHLRDLKSAFDEAEAACQLHRNAVIPDARIDELKKKISGAIRYCADAIKLIEAERTKVDLEILLANHHFIPVRWGKLRDRLEQLGDDIGAGIGRECFFHYPRDKAIMLFRVEQQWAVVIKSFSSARQEILSGIDAYAFGNNVACVFHMSRVAEIGLRALGKERRVKLKHKGKPIDIEWATWGGVLSAIDAKIIEITKKPNGPQKDKAFNFYKSAASDLRAIQSLYRDPTMHFREEYDPGQVQSAIFRTKSLMEALSTKLSDSSTSQIPWRAWK